MPQENAIPQVVTNNIISSVTGSGLISTVLSSSTYVVSISSSVITSASHETLRQLIHFIDEGPTAGQAAYYKTITPPDAIFPTTQSWFSDVALTKKVVEEKVLWAGAVITQSIWQVFDFDGVTPLQTVTDTITYVSGVFEASRVRNIS